MSASHNNIWTQANPHGESMTLQQEYEATTAQLHRLNEEVAMISRAASHDLATPLRDIHLLCDFINDSIENNDSASIKHNLVRIGNRATRLENMLNSVLRYIQASQRNYKKSTFDLVNTLTRQFEKAANSANFELKIETDQSEVSTYHSAFCIITGHILENAIKHHDKKQGEISAVIRHSAPDVLEITFEDDGPGIEKQYQKRVFTAFETLKPKDEVEGSGMGLTIAKRLLVNTNGSISIESPLANNRGTRLTVCFSC